MNLLGNGLPLLVGLLTIPFLINGYGVEKFGLLSIAWMVTGYFSLFDLGLGRALTQIVANKLGAKKHNEIPADVRVGLTLMFVFGLIAMAIVLVIAPFLVNGVFNFPGILKSEGLYVFYLLALSVPFVLVTTGLRGVLEAYQLFSIVNLIRVPMGIFIFVGPLLTLPYSSSLVPAVFVLVIVRIIGSLAHFWFCLKYIPILRRKASFEKGILRQLLTFGGWMTVSNIVGPVMVYFDRFLIGSMISLAAVAYYTTPYEVVTKLWIIPGALAGVLFPAFATAWAENKGKLQLLYSKGLKFTLMLLFPISLVVVLFARDGLNLWVGGEFASNGVGVMQWLMIGVFLNSFAQITFGFIQGVGRPDLTAKFHIAQFLPYVLMLWLLLKNYGIEGAAIAWCARVAVDLVGLMIMARYLVNSIDKIVLRYSCIAAISAIGLGFAMQVQELVPKMWIFALVLFLFVMFSWRAISSEKLTLKDFKV